MSGYKGKDMLLEMRNKLIHEATLAIDYCDTSTDKAMDHIEEAQQLLAAIRYQIWHMHHTSGVVK